MNRSPKFWLKLPHDFFDTIEDERERIHYRASLNPRATFPELHRNLNVRLHVHLRGMPNSQFGNYCVVFGYHAITDASIREISSKIDPGTVSDIYGRSGTNEYVAAKSPPATELDPSESDHCANHMDKSVFISVIDIAEEPEGVSVESFRSVVRLEPLDNCFVGDGDPPQIAIFGIDVPWHPIASQFSVKDWKLQPESSAVVCGQIAELGNEKVKGGASIMSKISDDGAPFQARPTLDISHQNIVRGLRLRLQGKGIRIRLDKPLDSRVQGIEVLLCPAKLQSWPIQGVHELYYADGSKDEQTEESKDCQGTHDSRVDAQRLLQESEESRHPISIPIQPVWVAGVTSSVRLNNSSAR